MKKLMLSIVIVGACLTSIAQSGIISKSEASKALERLNAELEAKTKEKDYNPYRSYRELFVISCLEVWMGYERDDCENVKEMIEMFYNNDTTREYRNDVDYMRHISRFRCQEARDFLIYQISNNNLSETAHYNTIVSLAWHFNPDYLLYLFEYAKKDSLSVKEKLALGGAFMIYGVYTFNPELQEKSIKFLDEVCYDTSLNIFDNCDGCYMKLGGKAAINFYTAWLEQQEELKRKVAIATYFLVPLGEYKITFSIFEEAIHSEDNHNILCAIDGLKVIGTKEAIHLIEKLTYSKNEKISKYAQEILKNLDTK